MCERLVVIGGGVVEIRGREAYAKAALVDYLREMRGRFEQVTWVVTTTDDETYRTPVDAAINLVELPSMRRLLRDGARRRIVMQQLRAASARTAVIGFLPNPLVSAMLWLFARRGAMIVAYIGGDWVAQAERRKQRGHHLWAALWKASMAVALRRAQYVFVRGEQVRAHALVHARKVALSEPILFTHGAVAPARPVDLVSPVVLYMGKLEAAKGVFVLLDALVLLRKDVPSLRAVFAGSGPAAGELRRRIHALSLSKTIELRGFVDDAAALTALYNEASVAVVPSIEPEGFPRVVEEALLHGLPIIATRCGGLPHVFEGKAEVAFVETGNATGLAASIRDFALNPATRARMIEAAARAARERATRRSAAAQHSDAILGGRP